MKYLQKLDEYILYILIFLLPLFFLPIFPSSFTTSRLLLAVFGASALLIIKCIRALKTGTLSVSLAKYDLPIILLAASFLISSILITPNKAESFFLPGEASFVIAGAILYFAINQLNEKSRHNLKIVLLISAAIYSITVIANEAGMGRLIPQLPSYAKDGSFNLMGSLIASLLFLIPIIPISIEYLKKESFIKKLIAGVSVSLSVLALAGTTLNILPGKATTPLIPSFQTSWIVSIETMKVSPILGVGPGNYLTAFNLYRPLEYNQTPLWQTRFNSASSFFLTVLTENGILGFGALLILCFSAIKSFRKSLFEKAPLIALLLLLILLPYQEVAVLLLFILASLATKARKVNLSTIALNYGSVEKDSDKKAQLAKLIPTLFVITPLLLGSVLIDLSLFNSLRAETKFKNAVDAVSQNDGKTAYDRLVEAININPFIDRYHVAFAQVNIALANTISQKKDITDTDKNTVSQLIDQAIREGKSSVSLNPQRSGNWEILGTIYKAIIPVAKDADKFTIQTYQQAIALDPLNPELRITLGGIYYSLKNFDAAIDTLKLAIVSKPDLANAHYNLSLAYKEKGQIDLAIQEMQTTLGLVKKDSQDYQVVQKALDDLQKNKQVTPEKSENLTPPETKKESPLNKKIDLSQEATPPASPRLPGETPTPSQSPSPTTNP